MARRRQTLWAAVMSGGVESYLRDQVRRKTAKQRAWLRAANTWKIHAFGLATFWYISSALGSMLYGILVSLILAAIGISLWYWYRYHVTGVSYKDAAKQMRRRKHLEGAWTKALIEGSNLVKAGGVVPPLKDITFDKGDMTAKVYNGSFAIATDDLAKNLRLFADVVGCREVTMHSPDPGVTYLRFCFSDPLAKVVTPGMLKPTQPGVAPHGLTTRGEIMGLPVLNKDGETIFTPVLNGGVSGSGKSSDVWSILGGFIVADIPVRFRVVDPAGGVEMAALGEAYDKGLHSERFSVHAYENNAAKAGDLIADMKADMNDRLTAMKAKGVRLHKPTPEEPLDLLLVDELLLLGDLLKKGVHSDLGQIMTVGRKAGYSVIACTQIGEKAQLGALRELFPRRICFRTNTREQTETILGSGGKADMAPAHRISDRTPGVGYSYDDATGIMVKFRAAYFTDLQTQQIAQGEVPSGMEHFAPEPEPEGLHALYRLNTHPARDGSRKRLYIGISNEPARRFDEHRKDKRWAKDVDWADATRNLAWYPTRADALAAEAEAIRDELPVHNKVHNQDNPARELEVVA